MMLDRENSNMVLQNTVINSVGETRHTIATDIALDDRPTVGRFQNRADSMVNGIEKLRTES